MDRDEAKEHIKANPEIYFQRARRSGYICPLCQNGAGKDGTGIKEIPTKKGVYKCFKCDFSGDVFGFIAKENNLDVKSDFPKVMDIAGNIYGITGDNNNYKKKREYNMKYSTKHSINKKDNKPPEAAPEPASALAETDYSDFFKKVAEHKNAHDYLKGRGLSEDVQKRFQIGYDPKWQCPTNSNVKTTTRVIIPTSKTSYLARATGNVDNYKAMKVGKVHIFNVEALDEDRREPIFVCEGEIDALSVIEAGGKAVGLGGVSGVSSFITELEKRKEKARMHTLLICLDHDEGGQKAAEGLEEQLKQKGYFYIDVCEELLLKKENEDKSKPEHYKDPNEALVGDKAGFKEKVAAAKAQAEEEIDKEKENYIQEYRDKVVSVLSSFYFPKRTVATGFEHLDKMLDGGLHAGLYVMAAASGAGKTTFALQIADNIAKSKQNVLFFSGEMSMPEIAAKSLSRLSKETCKGNDRNALTMRTILNVENSNNEAYKERLKSLIIGNYFGITEHIRIYDGLQELTNIKNKIAEHKRITGNNPVIFIDYLQIMKDTSSSSKDRRLQIDEIVSQLRIAAAEYETPVFVISSLNRTAYARPKSSGTTAPPDERELYMADLKESGGIEYGADVVITLTAEKEDDDSGDKKDVRPMKLRVIKNRTGKRHYKKEHISLDFYTRFNYFEKKGEKTEKSKENLAQIAGSDPGKIK
jgi:replicative DNA helicase